MGNKVKDNMYKSTSTCRIVSTGSYVFADYCSFRLSLLYFILSFLLWPSQKITKNLS